MYAEVWFLYPNCVSGIPSMNWCRQMRVIRKRKFVDLLHTEFFDWHTIWWSYLCAFFFFFRMIGNIVDAIHCLVQFGTTLPPLSQHTATVIDFIVMRLRWMPLMLRGMLCLLVVLTKMMCIRLACTAASICGRISQTTTTTAAIKTNWITTDSIDATIANSTATAAAVWFIFMIRCTRWW